MQTKRCHAMGHMILPPKDHTDGLEVRVLLAECRPPSYKSYNAADAQECMTLMDRVLWNRVNNPRPFGSSDSTLLGIVRAKGQFAGFESYPKYDISIVNRIQAMLDIASSARDSRSGLFAAHINMALQIS